MSFITTGKVVEFYETERVIRDAGFMARNPTLAMPGSQNSCSS